MSPFLCEGENYNKEEPRWNIYCDGDKDSEFMDIIELESKNFVPGTKIKVLEPCCPKCGEIASICQDRDYYNCDFDWEKWIENNYS